MAKRKVTPKVENIPTELTITLDEFTKQLDMRINDGEDLFNQQIKSQEDYNLSLQDYYSWDDYNSEFLKQVFNKENNEYKKRYDEVGYVYIRTVGGQKSLSQKVADFKNKINNKINNLKRLKGKSNLLKVNSDFLNINEVDSILLDKSKVFIVHGHDEEAKTKTARFVEKLGFESIILHEQASSSKTIIEKIEEYSNVGFGIILYTPCDIGSKNNKKPDYKSRARQNVVFEHGFLIGKIGRGNVCALVKGDIVTPNDISGVVYVPLENSDAWKYTVAKEMKKAGYKVDMNKI